MTYKPTIRGSRSSFMWGRTVYTKYSGGCLRHILIKSKGIDTDIDETHKYRGKLNEDIYEEALKSAQVTYEREAEIWEERPDGIFTGHADFIINDQVIELKSSQSKSRARDIKKGEYVTENLAQAVAYMVARNLDRGQLIYSYWEPRKDDGELEFIFEYVHHISLDNFGRICLNSIPTKWTIYDLLAHQHHALKVQTEHLVWDRPNNHAQLWGSPCNYCTFKTTCDKYDAGDIEGTDAFLESATRDAVSLANNGELPPSQEEVTSE